MDEKLKKTICPLPWLHFSAHLDSTMRICCNTDGSGFVIDDNGNNIKLSEVEDINSYFNLNYYKNIRQKMLNGKCPKECSKCYQIEAYGGHSVRQGYLSEYSQNQDWLNSVRDTDTATGEVKPKVQSLDFSLSNKCNLKCIMCSPASSYLLRNDFDQLGLDYSIDFVEGANKNWNNNPAIERLIPSIAPDLKSFLTTGGEPFLSREHIRILELLVQGGNASKIRLNYHTNCTVKNERLFELWNHFEAVSVHFSIDAHGELNEYIRFKTKWADVEKNVRLMLDHPKTHCEIHSTIQVLNIFNLDELYEWSRQFNKIPKLPYHIWMDQPEWLMINILPLELKQLALEKIKTYFGKANLTDPQSHERMAQIISYLNRSIEEGTNQHEQDNFKKRIREFERIRQTKPIEFLVPELKGLFN